MGSHEGAASGADAIFARSIHPETREAFWAEQAERLFWKRRWTRVLNAERLPFTRWFEGGLTNLCYNCVDRHVPTRGKQTAVIVVSTETGTTIEVTYAELHKRVLACAAVLKAEGLQPGDRVLIYMPMILETLVAMLAVVRLGAIHSVVFGGFAPRNLAQRIDDATPRLLLTTDAGIRGGKIIPYKAMVDQALAAASHAPHRVLMVSRGLAPEFPWNPPRDIDLSARLDAELPRVEKQETEVAEPHWVESNHPSYVLYTSGTTGTPKGIQRDSGGYATALAASMPLVYDVHPGETMFTTSDFGWVVGHSYIVYAPLLNGSTTIVHEGTPLAPDPGIWWRIVAEHQVDVMFSAPTAMRMLRKYDVKYLREADLSCLRHLFIAGEPLDAASYEWLAQGLQKRVIDHYWQTESGWPMLANMAGVELLPIKPGSPTKPVFGWELDVVDERSGERSADGERGLLVATPPLPPGTMSTIWKNDERFVAAYYRRFTDPLRYYSGDYAIRDADGYFFMLGRADEVINIAAHRLGTREIEAAIAAHPQIAEAAAVGVADEVKGQAVVALIVLKEGVQLEATEAQAAVNAQVEEHVGAIARPRAVHVVPGLPKTRSGKILRRVIQDLAEERAVGELPTLDDPQLLDRVRRIVQAPAG